MEARLRLLISHPSILGNEPRDDCGAMARLESDARTVVCECDESFRRDECERLEIMDS